MNNKQITILGLDISKTTATYWLLNEIPEDPKAYARHFRENRLQANQEGRERLLSLEFDFAVLEPTGVYSRIWRTWLREAGREYRLVGHEALASYRKGWKLQKTDKLDGLTMAMYGLERGNQPELWLIEKDYVLADLVAYHQHLNRQKNGFINNLRQKIVWQAPELYGKEIRRKWGNQKVPGIYQAIAGNPSNKWRRELEGSCGAGIRFEAQSLARILIAIEQEEIAVEQQIAEELGQPQYELYREAAAACGFSDWLEACLIAAIYPFEQFLEDGRPRIIHYLSREKGKRVRRDQSLRAFKLACGQGLIWAESGDYSGWTPGGSGSTRMALRNSVRSSYLNWKKEIKQGKGSEDSELSLIKHQHDNQGMMKIARRWTERFYRELKERICK